MPTAFIIMVLYSDAYGQIINFFLNDACNYFLGVSRYPIYIMIIL